MYGRVLIALAALLCSAFAMADETTFYVASDGNDAWSGTRAGANIKHTDGPFATMQRALEQVREARTHVGGKDTSIVVNVRGGRYYLSQPVIVDAGMCGSEKGALVLRAHKKEKAHLIGGVRAGDWQPFSGEILQRDLRGAGFDKAPFVQLFSGSSRLTLARWPNADTGLLPSGGWTFVAFKDVRNSYESFGFADGRPNRWKHPEDCWISIWPSWNYRHILLPVKSIDLAAHTVTMDGRSPYAVEAGRRFFYENVFEELDTPGEWFFDRRTETLYLWPNHTTDISDVTLPVLDTIVMLRSASHVRIEGFTIEVSRKDAITFDNGTSNCVLAGNTIRHTGLYAVRVEGGHDNAIVGSDIYDTGKGGVTVQGGNRHTLDPGNHVVQNNHIHHYGQRYRTYEPAVYVDGVGNRVLHNLIHDAAHCFMWVTGNDNIIEYNEIHHVNMEGSDNGAYLMGRDWTQRGNIIRYNYFHDLYGFGMEMSRSGEDGVYRYETPHDTYAIYLDDGISGTQIYGNVFCRVVVGAVTIGSGHDNHVFNNIFVDSMPAYGLYRLWPTYDWSELEKRLAAIDYMSPPYSTRYPKLTTFYEKRRIATDNRFERNIVSYDETHYRNWIGRRNEHNAPVAYHIHEIDMPSTTINHNLVYRNKKMPQVFFDPSTEEGVEAEVVSWDEWRSKSGFDADSVVADPKFRDPAKDDYRLASNSPALELGFEPIPIGKIGLYKDKYRASWPIPKDERTQPLPFRAWEVTIPVVTPVAWLCEAPETEASKMFRVNTGRLEVQGPSTEHGLKFLMDGKPIATLRGMVHQLDLTPDVAWPTSHWIATDTIGPVAVGKGKHATVVDVEMSKNRLSDADREQGVCRFRGLWRFWIPLDGSEWVAYRCMWIENLDSVPWRAVSGFAYVTPADGTKADWKHADELGIVLAAPGVKQGLGFSYFYGVSEGANLMPVENGVTSLGLWSLIGADLKSGQRSGQARAPGFMFITENLSRDTFEQSGSTLAISLFEIPTKVAEQREVPASP